MDVPGNGEQKHDGLLEAGERMDLSERELIDQIAALIPEPSDRTLLGIGDDAAILQAGARSTVVTTDTFTEWVHFRMDHLSPDQVGFKSMSAAISDCAAMGAAPRWVTISVAAPDNTSSQRILSMYHGIVEAARAHECDIVGGDTVRSMSDLTITITVIGEPLGERIWTRSGAQIGDDVLVTGELGGPMAALALLENEARMSLDERYQRTMIRFLRPEARVDVARALASFPITSAIDISDGLSTELHHIARASGIGFHIERETIPLYDGALVVAEDLGYPAEAFALFGGEEFELLLTVEPGYNEELVHTVEQETGLRLTRIGTVVDAEEGVTLFDSAGGSEVLEEKGYEHFG